MKKEKIIFWTTTALIFLFEGVMPAFTFQTEMAKEGIHHLGYPEYFGTSLVFAKILGTLALIIPKVPQRVKEWAYAGLTFDFIFAMISHIAVDGWVLMSFFPLLVMAILAISYVYNRKLQTVSSK